MADKARHAFGSSANIQTALASGKIDAYDILFLDGDTEPKVGWIDKDGKPVIVEGNTSELEGQVAELEAEIAKKVSAEEVETKIADVKEEVLVSVDEKVEASVESAVEAAVADVDESYEKVAYEISHKPEGTLVNEHDKEIRVMCPANTVWSLQQSGEGADANKYYIGFKAYAPTEDVVSFKEDLAETIADDTMYYFEGNDFAGVDANGRKYSIVWLPVAVYDEASNTWTYYGANSSEEKYIGWYYSVEWYNADGVIVASDCIRVNLSNEECYSSIKPFYVNSAVSEVDTKIDEATQEAVNTAKAYTDEQIANAIAIEVIEF